MSKLFFLTILISVFYGSAAFASLNEFNTCKSDSNAHQFLCKNKELEIANNNLEIKYKKINSALTKKGQLLFKNDVRSWLNFVSTTCRRDKEVNFYFLDNENECIKNKYRERIKYLDGYTFRKNGILFNRISSFKAREADANDETGWNQGYITVELSYLQIDKPQTKSIENFNFFSKRTASNFVGDEENTDYIVDYKILTVSPELISIVINGSKFTHGAPHGDHDFKIIHWLTLKGKNLKIKDIFSSPTAASKEIVAKCKQILLKRKYQNYYSSNELAEMVMNLDRWELTQGGIMINFKFDEVMPYADGEPGVFISWRELNSHLNKKLPFSMKKLSAK